MVVDWKGSGNSILDFKLPPCSECCILSSGNSPASEFYMPTFRNTLFHLHIQVGMKYTSYPPAYENGTECSETSACKIQTQKKAYNKWQQPKHGSVSALFGGM